MQLSSSGLLTHHASWVSGCPRAAFQVAQNMHALYSFKNRSTWLLLCDVDEFVFTTATRIPDVIHEYDSNSKSALQFTSYLIKRRSKSAPGSLSSKQQYGGNVARLKKGKVIIKTARVTGQSVHMVTDVAGGEPVKSEGKMDTHHTVIPAEVALLAHFQNALDLVEDINRSYQQFQTQAAAAANFTQSTR